MANMNMTMVIMMRMRVMTMQGFGGWSGRLLTLEKSRFGFRLFCL